MNFHIDKHANFNMCHCIDCVKVTIYQNIELSFIFCSFSHYNPSQWNDSGNIHYEMFLIKYASPQIIVIRPKIKEIIEIYSQKLWSLSGCQAST